MNGQFLDLSDVLILDYYIILSWINYVFQTYFYGIKECSVSLVAAILGKSWEDFIDDSILQVIMILILTLIYECFHLLHG